MPTVPDPISSILNTIFSGQDAKWGQSALINVLNTMNQANGTGLGLGISAFDPARNQAMADSGLAGNLLRSPVGGLESQQQAINNYLANIQRGDFTQSGLQGRNGANLDYLANANAQHALNAQDKNSYGSDAYGRMMAGNGQVVGNQQDALNTLSSLLGGGGALEGMNAAGNAAIQNGGMSGYDSGLQNMSNYVLQRGGYDQNLNALGDAGKNALANQGLTATGAAAQNEGLQGLLRQGQTGTTSRLQDIGTNLASQSAILPSSLVAGFAKDQAGEQARKSAENFQAQALARGGGAGSTVANGAQNAGLADFANQMQEAQANAYQNALTQQQGLNLQQQGQGAQMALGAGGLAAGQLGTYGNLLTGQQGVQNQTLATGGNLLGNAAQGANAAMGTYGNLAGQAGQIGNQRLATGLGALNNVAGNQINASQGINALSDTQIKALLGAGAGLNANANTANTAYDRAVNNQLGSGALGNTQSNSYYSQLLGMLGAGNQANQNQLGLNSDALKGLLGLTAQGFDYAGKGLAGQAGLFPGYASQTARANSDAWSGLGQSIGGMDLGGLGSAVNSGIGAITGGYKIGG